MQFGPSITGEINAKFGPAFACSLSLQPLTSEPREYMIKEVQLAVCQATNIHLKDMVSPRRKMHLIEPRHLAMALSKRLTKKSFPEIGRRFGGRDHSTVFHAVDKFEAVILDIDAVIEARMPLMEIVSAALKSFERLKPPPAERRRLPKGQFA